MKFITILLALFFPVVALAVQNQYGQATQTTQAQNQNTNQNQAQTNNPETGDMVQTQDQTQARVQSPTASETPLQVKDQLSQRRGNAVAEAAQNLVQASYKISNTGVGDQIRTIAQTQLQDTNRVNQSIDKAEQRTSFAKFFIGPNYKELKNARQLREQNRQQIMQLEQLALQLTNESEETTIVNAIATLQAENSSLGGQIDELSKGFCLFGWLNRWINGY